MKLGEFCLTIPPQIKILKQIINWYSQQLYHQAVYPQVLIWELQPLSFVFLLFICLASLTSSFGIWGTTKPFILLSSQISFQKLFCFFKLQIYLKKKNLLHLPPAHSVRAAIWLLPPALDWVLIWRSPAIHQLKPQWPFSLSLCFFISATVEFLTTFSLKFSVPAVSRWMFSTPPTGTC